MTGLAAVRRMGQSHPLNLGSALTVTKGRQVRGPTGYRFFLSLGFMAPPRPVAPETSLSSPAWSSLPDKLSGAGIPSMQALTDTATGWRSGPGRQKDG